MKNVATTWFTPAEVARARWAIATLFFINGMGFATWIPHIPWVQRRFELDEASLGLTLLAIAAGAVLTMPVAGGLVTRWGSRRVCSITSVAFCCVVPLPLLMTSYPLLVFSLFLLGAFGGAADVAMNAHGVYVEREHQQPIMSSFHGMFSLGGLMGAGVAAGLLAVGWLPWQHAVAISVSLLLLAAGATRYLLPPEAIEESSEAEPLFTLPRQRPVILLAGLAFFVLMTEGAMADWTAVYLEAMPRTTASLAAMGFAAFSLTMAAGRFAGDAIIRLAGRVPVVRWGSGLAFVGVLLASLSSTPLWAIVGFALVGLGVSNVVPIIFSAAGYLSPAAPGRGIAAVTTAGYFGFLAGPPLIGLLAEWVTLAGAFRCLAVALLLVVAQAALVEKK